MTVATFEQAKEYLARVLPWPQEGDAPFYVNIHWTFQGNNAKKPGWGGRACRSVSEAANAVQFALKGKDTRDIYACMSGQREAEEKTTPRGYKYLKPIRLQHNAVSLKALFLDIDFKGGAHGYDTPKEAISALGNFVRTVGLPSPSMVVSSGGGIHVYWVHSPLPPNEWAPLAFALAEATKQHGLKCDTQVSIDSARILRVPDTFNRKTDDARPVRIVAKGHDYTTERLARVLEPYKTVVPVNASSNLVLPARPPLPGDSDLSAGVEMRASDPILLKTVVPECGFIRNALATGGAQYTNPLWSLTTLISTFCTSGNAMAHLMARKHPEYTRESTEELFARKSRESEEKGLGWPSCATISASGATACQSCPHLKLGKSPLNFGRREAPASPSQNNPAAATTVPQADLPSGYTRRSDGVVCRLDTQDDGTTAHVPICDYRIDEPWLQTNPQLLHFTTTTSRNENKQVTLPLRIIGGMEMRGVLQEQGVMLPVGNKATEHVARFFVSWIKQLQDTRDSVSSSPFGWSLKKGKGALDGFAFGDRLWTPNGDKAAATPDTVIAQHYTPSGDMQPWRDAANMVLSQGRQDLAAILASAFGAPLVRFTGQPGVLMSAYSSESGIGKSTALRIAQSVWGDPVRAIQSLSDTQNAVMHKLGEIRSLPLYWDELKTEEDTRKFVNITFQTTQGKEKSRLTSRVTQREPGSWQTLLVSASNDSLMDYVLQQTNTTTAGLIRIFEYVVAPAPQGSAGQIDTSDASLIVAKLNDNHGQVGLQYAKFLGENHETIAKDISTYLRALGKEVNESPDERFWLALIACICMGAKYANQLGFTAFDEPALKAFMVHWLNRMRDHRTEQPVDMSNSMNVNSLLSQYLGAMKAKHTLFTNKLHVSRGPAPSGSIKVVGDISRLEAIYVHVGVEDKYMRISSAHIGEWLKTKGYSRHIVTTAMQRELGLAKVIGRLGSGTGNPRLTGGKEYLLQIDLAGTPIANFIDDV